MNRYSSKIIVCVLVRLHFDKIMCMPRCRKVHQLLQEMEIETIEVVSPVGTLYGSMYPNANLCVEMDDDLLYLDKSSSGVVAVGIADLPVSNVMMIPLPLTFGLTYQDGPNTITDSIFVNTGAFSIPNTFTT